MAANSSELQKICYNAEIMKTAAEKNKFVTADKKVNQCLSCGTTENMGRKRYCSRECQRVLFHRLDILTSLLRALSTKYAAFYFTETNLILELLPFDSNRVYRFLYERTHGRMPAQDLFDMTDSLGKVWWEKKRITGKRYRASQYLLGKALNNNITSDTVVPIEIKRPIRIGRHLKHLNLTNDDLNSHNPREAVKSAYRREALKNHPDCGGDSKSFRKINHAYQEVVNWLNAPELRKRRGIPGKWCFDGTRWITPLRASKKTGGWE